MNARQSLHLALTLLLPLGLAPALRAQQPDYALAGTLMTPHGAVERGIVLVSRGAIAAVGENIALPPGTPLIETGGVIFPGLIDLHNHLIWNVFPRWTPPAPVGDRYDWQAMSAYNANLSGPEATMVSRGDACEMERYAEVKAMLGGVTSVVGSYGPSESDPHANDCVRGLARNLDAFSGLYSTQTNAEPLDYEVFPLEIPYRRAQAIRDAMAAGTVKALLVHIAEGKDASASREFRMLRAGGFVRPGVSVIHGVGLHEADLREMAANGMGLVWSPHSNFALYGQTTDMAAAKHAGLTIALAPDWSPSGSNGMTEELRYAYLWNSRQTASLFDPADFVRMATANPAKLAAAQDRIGALVAGLAADLVVYPRSGASAAMALLEAKPGSVRLVVVGGKPMLGEPELMRTLAPGRPMETASVCGYAKALNIADDTGGESWAEITRHLAGELDRVHLKLAELAACEAAQ